MAQRIRNFGIVSYIPDSNEIQKRLDNHITSINRYAYAKHDKDEADTHHHILIWTNNALQYNTVRKWFLGCLDEKNQEYSCLAKPIQCDESACVYLTHSNSPGKYQYDESIIKSFNLDINAFNDELTDNGVEAIELMLNGVPIVDIARKKGRDFIYHFDSYQKIVKAIRDEEEEVRRFKKAQFIEASKEIADVEDDKLCAQQLGMTLEEAFPNKYKK